MSDLPPPDPAQRQAALDASRAAADQLAPPPLSEVVPSRRDFLLAVTSHGQEIVPVGHLSATAANLGELAAAWDDAEVDALSLTLGTEPTDERSIVNVLQPLGAPVASDDLVVDSNQIYAARLLGFDAVTIPGFGLTKEQLTELAAVAASTHMAIVVEVGAPEDLELASAVPRAVLGIRTYQADPDAILQVVREIGRAADPSRAVLILDELPANRIAELSACCDGAVIAADTTEEARIRSLLALATG